MECLRPGCSFLRHPNLGNNGGTHCCAACKRTGGHGPMCGQISLEENAKKRRRRKRKRTTKTPTTTKATTKATTNATTKASTSTTTTTAYPWPPIAVVKVNGADISPVYFTATKAYFQILNSGTVSSTLNGAGVLVSRGKDGNNVTGMGSASGGMIPIDISANISYTLDISTNSSITNGARIRATNSTNSVFGGSNQGYGADNGFGKGIGGGPGVGWAKSGSGYGAGAGGGYASNFFGGGGGGFDPNVYYNLPRVSGVPADQPSPLQDVPVSDTPLPPTSGNANVVAPGKPGVLFLELTKP